MVFEPDPSPPGSLPCLEEVSGQIWTPLFSHGCSFPPEIFREVMLNLIRNPNINSNHLFRADILMDAPFTETFCASGNVMPRITQFKSFSLKTVMIRTMIPRNIIVDNPLDQTCLLYEQTTESQARSLVIYLPHISSGAESPFYHPAVRGIGFLHAFNRDSQEGAVSIHYCFFDSEPRSSKLERTALHLLAVLHKHGQGLASGYVKRVQHDVILPQAAVQNTYARLKAKYARTLIEGWVESTDPAKHVFEDLGIAAFLIELWREMYKDDSFPGFVDIGCGNGLLVHILLQEGYSGWGFDARKRKSWPTYSQKAQENLKEMVLIPSIIQKVQLPIPETSPPTCPNLAKDLTNQDTLHLNSKQKKTNNETDSTKTTQSQNSNPPTNKEIQVIGIHNGLFPKGTFIISNHADELTPWTPILASLSQCPFMMIPCCSHALSGARFRAPPPKDAPSSTSAFASLVAWVSKLAKDSGWDVEVEMLRIPSTRNTALIGRSRNLPFEDVDVKYLIGENGGAVGWEENALKLVKSAARGH